MLSERLIDSAIEHFGRRGFEGASTREIAAASGTAMSSITYHFGGKEGLYLAVADHVANRIAARQADAIAAARDEAVTSREQATESLLTLLDSFGRMMLAPQSAAWASFVLREQQQPTAAFERLYEGAMKGIVEAAISLFAKIRPDLNEAEMRATVIMLFGQAMILRSGRAAVCRALGADAISPAMESMLLARLRANSLAILSEGPG